MREQAGTVSPSSQTANATSLVRILGSRIPPSLIGLTEHTQDAPGRAQVEAFIRQAYLEHFEAHLKDFMPNLLAMHDERGRVRAAAGYCGAADGALFLETYTRQPIEEVIAARCGQIPARDQIVEVGSFACRGGRAAIELIRALVPYLISTGFAWVVFTGADTVVNVFKRLRLEPRELCRANKALLGEAQCDWGSYYEHNPIVMAGRLIDGMDQLELIPSVQW